MAWHYHGETPVKWGGYAWGPQLFPEPEHFLEQVASANLNVTLNLHLDPIEPPPVTPQPSWEKFTAALGLPRTLNTSIPGPGIPGTVPGVAPSSSSSWDQRVVTLLSASKTFGEAYLNLLDDMGTNFWYVRTHTHDTPCTHHTHTRGHTTPTAERILA